MINQKNSALWFKLNGITRYALMHTATRIFPLYIVNEYPKSGGSWVGEMLGDALGVPFPRNRLPMFKSSILHCHMMQSWNMDNILIVWRDGRDVLVSQYFHSLFKNDRGNMRLVEQCRADLGFKDYSNVHGNLPAFMKYVYEQSCHPIMSWAEFVKRWASCTKCVHVKYENLRSHPVEELCRVVLELKGEEFDLNKAKEIVEKHSFEKMAGRKAGEENMRSFMRKGVVGDWKNYFNQEARERFHKYAGEALLKLGYESGSEWVSINDNQRNKVK